MEYDEKIKLMDDKHIANLQDMEASYQQRIMSEVERYQQLVQERDLQKKQWQDKQAQLVESHETLVEQVTEEFEGSLEEDRQLRQQMEEEKVELIAQFEETKRQYVLGGKKRG